MKIYQQKTNPANVYLVIYWDSLKPEYIKKISFNQKLFFDDVINTTEDTCLVRTSFQTSPGFSILKRKYYNIYGIGNENVNAWANLTKEDFENGATYISVMEQNLEALKEALY